MKELKNCCNKFSGIYLGCTKGDREDGSNSGSRTSINNVIGVTKCTEK